VIAGSSRPMADLRPRAGAEDLFNVGRRACAARRALFGDAATFIRSRQLLATGAWRGPRDAALSFVDEDDLPALGGLAAARTAGARVLVGDGPAALDQALAAGGLRVLWRMPYRAGEGDDLRRRRFAAVAQALSDGAAPWAVLPTPDGEPQGLDTLDVTARCRLDLPGSHHVVADFQRLGPRLAQMALGFGADELFGPIVAERALRLGDNARNPAMTRKEAATLIRGAGLRPFERGIGDALDEAAP